MGNYGNRKRKRYNYDGATIHERRLRLDSIKQLMEKNPAKALADLNRQLDEHPDDMYSWFYYGKVCQDTNNFEEAEYAYSKVAESTSPNKYAGVAGLGDVAKLKGNTELAKYYYRRAINEHPTEYRTTFYQLARLESQDGNHEEALRILNLLDPEYNETKIEKVRVLVDAREYETSQELLDSIVPKSEQEKRSIDFEKAKLATLKKDIPTAKYYFMEARQCQIKDDEYYKVLSEEARFACNNKDYQLAIDDCEEALSANQTAHGENYLTLGIAKMAQKQFKSAITCFELAQTDPNSSYTPKASCSYYLGCIQMTLGNLEAAEKNLKASIVPDVPPRPSIIDLLTNIYIRQGRYQEAIEMLDKAEPIIKDERDKYRINFSRFMVQALMGEITPEQRSLGRNYREKQIIDYKKDEAIIHIKNHHTDDSTTSSFPETIDISALYDEILPQLTDENRAVVDTMDRYYIDYPNAGYTSDGELVNRIGIVVIPGTKKILTMYPDADNDRYTAAEIEQSIGNNKTIGPKSRAAEFNRKFAKFIPPMS